MSKLVIPQLETIEEVETTIDEAKLKLKNELNNKDKIGIKTRADMLVGMSQVVIDDNEVIKEITPDYSDILELESTEEEALQLSGLEIDDENQKFNIKQTKSRLDEEFFIDEMRTFETEIISKERMRMLELNQKKIIQQQEIIQKQLAKEMQMLEEVERRRLEAERQLELNNQARVARYQSMFAANVPKVEKNTRKFSEEDRISRLSELEKKREVEAQKVEAKKERRKKMETTFERYYIKESESNIIGFKQRKKRGDEE